MKKIGLLMYCLYSIAVNAQEKPPLPQFSVKEKNQVIDTLVANLHKIYVYEEVAKKMSEAIRQNQKNGAYNSILDRAAFADRLTQDVQNISKDRHLGIEFSSTAIGNESPGNPPDSIVHQFKNYWASNNFNFKKLEILDGNIGLLQLNTFFPADYIKDLAAASMAFLSNADAIIIDLRNNNGYADGVLLIQSYFFNEPVHLADSYDREANTIKQIWTLPVVPGSKLPDKDLYILVSKNTFSAPEDFTYNLQAHSRAKVIGEVTGGGAHATKPFKIGDYFLANIPFSYEVNTVTLTDWEGKGIQPDVKVPANQALLTAQILAIQNTIKRNNKETERVKNLEKVVARLERELKLVNDNK